MGSCKKVDLQSKARVYFTYEVGYTQSKLQPDGSMQDECISGDGMCAFEVRDAGWRPSGRLPEGQGFGYLTLNGQLKPQLVIYMPFMALGTYQQHYADGTADIPGEWKLAAKLVTGIGLTDAYTVSMGGYKISVGEEDGYEVLIVSL
jgi:hypothetical protein